MRKYLTFSALFCAASVIAACSGGSTNPGAIPQANAKTVPVSFFVAIPSQTTSSHLRKPAYVSGNTQSATVTVTAGTASATATIACTTSGATPSCSGSVLAPVGSDTFVVKLYSGTGGTGNVLSQGNTTQTISANQSNSVNVTFNPVLKNVILSLSKGTLAAGTAATDTLYVIGQDPAGYTILGPGVFVDANGNPTSIVVSNTDHVPAGGTGATTLSQTTLAAPLSSGVTISYNGGQITSTDFNATIATGSVTPVTLYYPAPAPTPASSYLYLPGGSQISAYGLPASASSGSYVTFGNNTYTSAKEDAAGNIFGVPVYASAPRVDVYQPPFASSSTPAFSLTLTVPATPDPNGRRCMALDGSGNLYVTGTEKTTANGNIGVFAPPFANGNTPVLNVGGTFAPTGILVSGTQLIVATGKGLAVYNLPLSSTSTVQFTIDPTLSEWDVATDGSGHLFAANGNTIKEYNLPLSSSSTETLIMTAIPTPTFMAFDSAGNLYAANSYAAQGVSVVNPPFTGTSPVAYTIGKGSLTVNGCMAVGK